MFIFILNENNLNENESMRKETRGFLDQIFTISWKFYKIQLVHRQDTAILGIHILILNKNQRRIEFKGM